MGPEALKQLARQQIKKQWSGNKTNKSFVFSKFYIIILKFYILLLVIHSLPQILHHQPQVLHSPPQVLHQPQVLHRSINEPNSVHLHNLLPCKQIYWELGRAISLKLLLMRRDYSEVFCIYLLPCTGDWAKLIFNVLHPAIL